MSSPRPEEHPGITFRSGPTGWRAGLVGGPDVWEVIGALRAVRLADPYLTDEPLIDAVTQATRLSPGEVRVVLRYYTAHPAEVDERLAANDKAAREAEAAWRALNNLDRHRT